jgi:predicted dinucleotide-binding enzyme
MTRRRASASWTWESSWGTRLSTRGPLLNARYLEPMGELLIQLGYGQGLGTDLGFALQAGGRG